MAATSDRIGIGLPQPGMAPSGHLHTRNQLMSFLLASVIAVLLLGVLAVITLF